MTLIFHPYDSSFVTSVRAGGPDAYGRPAETARSDGAGNPCRSCLANIEAGATMLILAARPFPQAQPYAETGPIFLCADACEPWRGAGLPPILTTSATYLLRGYSSDNRIVSGTGKVVEQAMVETYAQGLLDREKVAYVDVRSASNNCFETRITRRQ